MNMYFCDLPSIITLKICKKNKNTTNSFVQKTRCNDVQLTRKIDRICTGSKGKQDKKRQQILYFAEKVHPLNII